MTDLLPKTGTVAAYYATGSGTTTTLIALISNAGPEDQAIATAGIGLFPLLRPFYITLRHFSLDSFLSLSVSGFGYYPVDRKLHYPIYPSRISSSKPLR
jgi:hypothetical protein